MLPLTREVIPTSSEEGDPGPVFTFTDTKVYSVNDHSTDIQKVTLIPLHYPFFKDPLNVFLYCSSIHITFVSYGVYDELW